MLKDILLPTIIMYYTILDILILIKYLVLILQIAKSTNKKIFIIYINKPFTIFKYKLKMLIYVKF